MAAAPAMPPGQGVYQRHCQACHGADRKGLETGLGAGARRRRSGEQHRGWRAPIQRGGASHRHRDRQGPYALISASDNERTSTTSSPSSRRRGGRPGAAPAPAAAAPVPRDRAHRRSDCRIRIGVDAAGAPPAAAVAAPRAVPRGHPRLHALHDHRIQHGRQPH